MIDRILFDGFKISPDEASELCIHHLRMAATLFEVVPDDMNASILAELDRIVEPNDRGMIGAAKAFLASMLDFHEGLKKDFPIWPTGMNHDSGT